jgi:hypothetical protein
MSYAGSFAILLVSTGSFVVCAIVLVLTLDQDLAFPFLVIVWGRQHATAVEASRKTLIQFLTHWSRSSAVRERSPL